MKWNNAATWDNTLIWNNTDDLGSIVESTETLAPVTGKVNTVGLIRSIVPAKKSGYSTITGDVELTGLVPDRAFIQNIIIINSTANAGQIKAGSSSGGTWVFPGTVIAASGATVISIGKYFTTLPSIFLADGGGAGWNSMSIDIHILYWKL